jgi:glycerophosphoryl diester phosphodiesterase
VKKTPLLLGHRGVRGRGVPENTFAAFELALQHGCDGFEFDVRLTGAGNAVVCHDLRWRGLALANASLSQLSGLCLLKDVLAKFVGRAFLDIELKVQGLERQVLELLQQSPPAHGYVISSFLRQVLLELRRLSETACLGILFDKRRTNWQSLPVQYVLPKRSLLTPNLVDEVHEAGKRVMTWTVNDKASMLRFASWDVDGIISDKTELLVATLKLEQRARSHSFKD